MALTEAFSWIIAASPRTKHQTLECFLSPLFGIQASRLLTPGIRGDGGAVNHRPRSPPETAACKFYLSLRRCSEGVHSHSRAVCRSPSRPWLAQEMKTKLRETLCFRALAFCAAPSLKREQGSVPGGTSRHPERQSSPSAFTDYNSVSEVAEGRKSNRIYRRRDRKKQYIRN